MVIQEHQLFHDAKKLSTRNQQLSVKCFSIRESYTVLSRKRSLVMLLTAIGMAVYIHMHSINCLTLAYIHS